MFTPANLNTLHRMQTVADRTRWMIHRRAIEAYCAALGGHADAQSRLDMCIIHNSLLSFEQGKPWPGIDYSLMRKARWLCEKSFEPSRIVTAWYRRKCGIKN